MSEPITRRQALAALTAAGTAMALPRRARAQRAQPNVVFVLVDDLRWDALSCLGHPFLRTPHIDRLAREGARFENAFVTISLCSPSRAGFLTGCEPQRTTVLTNEANDYDHRLPTFPSLLQQAGYDTAYVGKWHMEPDPNPRPGFDYWLSFRGQGKYLNPDLNENGRDFKREGYITDLLTEYATSWLRRDRRQPFCLYLSHKAVHGPFTPAERHQNAFPDARLPVPPNALDDLSGKPWWQRAVAVRGARAEAWRKNADREVPDRLPDRAVNPRRGLNYYRTILAVDDSVGAVLETLEQVGVLDDTMVIFTSDNGFFHAEHRRGDKRLAYEESIRIPMIVRYPGLARPGSVIRPMALNIDVCPTILDVCGVAPPEVVHGRSFKPLLADPAAKPADWRDAFLYQYFQEGWLEGIPDIQAVRTERWKYITAPAYDDARELYDLETDPGEMTNLAADPAYADIRAGLEARLRDFLAAAEASKLPPPPPPPPPRPETLLAYTFDRPGEVVKDASGGGRDGRAVGVEQREVAGRPARVFAGEGRITVESRKSPPIQGKPFWVRATLRADAPDGVIVSHGGQSNGYSLELIGGRPGFVVRSRNDLFEVLAEEPVSDRWVSIAGVLRNDGTLALLVDGREVARRSGVRPVAQLPNEGLTVGADEGTRVGAVAAKPFQGALASLGIGVGEMTAE